MPFVVKQGNLCITQELGTSSRIRQSYNINYLWLNANHTKELSEWSVKVRGNQSSMS